MQQEQAAHDCKDDDPKDWVIVRRLLICNVQSEGGEKENVEATRKAVNPKKASVQILPPS